MFVGRLTDKIVKSDLVNYFEQYGAVHNVHYDHGRKQFAFVEFEDPEVAEVVLREKTHLIDVGFIVFIAPAVIEYLTMTILCIKNFERVLVN